ncbi:MAG: DNA recombination/repair protein RecA [Acidobacteriota bacterium]|nr:DNA recombination/repair protein RecA [Acidobacteriota bacterium]
MFLLRPAAGGRVGEMGASRIALEQLLDESALRARTPGSLLAGASARLTRASELTLPARAATPLSGSAGGPLDRLLGPLPKGSLVELVGRRTSGRHSLALAALASVTSAGEPAGLVDLGDHFDPQAAARAGVELERLLWIRPPRVKSALASAEMLLATGFPLVVADLGLFPRGVKFVPDAAWVRLARAAHAQGARLLVVTPWRMSGIAAEAVVAADVARPVWLGSGKSPRLLDGISSRATLEKFGRETPGTSVSIGLRVGEAIPGLSFPSDHPIPLLPIDRPITRSPDHPILPSATIGSCA